MRGKEAAQRRRRTLCWAAAVAALVITGIAVWLSPAVQQRYGTAMIVNDHRVSPAMFNFFYRQAYLACKAEYGMQIQDFPAADADFEQLYCDIENGVTWADYFQDQAVRSVGETYALYDQARQAGMSLTEAQEAEIASELQLLETNVTNMGYSDFADYMTRYFGAGCNAENYKAYLRITALAALYDQHLEADVTASSQEALDAAYAADPWRFDTVSYRLFPIYTADLSDAYASEKEALAFCEELGTAMAAESSGSEEIFAALAYAFAPAEKKSAYAVNEGTYREEQSYPACPPVLAEWLFSPERTPLETAFIQNGAEGGYVCQFLNRNLHDTATVNIRHILIAPQDPGDEASWTAARESAERLLNAFRNGDADEAYFARLASLFTEDSAAYDDGGLYEKLHPGTLPAAVDQWCFAAARRAGDCEIVRSDIGFHILYFAGTSELWRNDLVRDALLADARSAVYAAAQISVRQSGMRWITR